MWDTRAGSSPLMSVKEPLVGSRLSSSVICLHPLCDHNYVVLNALNSKVSTGVGDLPVHDGGM